MRASTTKGTVITGRGAQKNSSFKHSQYGFTIVEVLIVLAVTGILFASTLSLMSGRQNRAEFTQAINNIKSQIIKLLTRSAQEIIRTMRSLLARYWVLGSLL